ncbi:MAG: hypothetical protein IT243_00280 [Bacteroidia bacterium]|nr:hypothetical protein [Bacteroidia bacterium]
MGNSKCVNNNFWLQYSQGKLSNTEINNILLHIEKCKLCAEIKEGIDKMKKPSELSKITNEIDKEIDKKISQNSIYKLFIRYSSVAAIFIVVVGLAWYFTNKKKPEVVIDKIEKTIDQNILENKVDSPEKYTDNYNLQNKIIDSKDFEEKSIKETLDTTFYSEKNISEDKVIQPESSGAIAKSDENSEDIEETIEDTKSNEPNRNDKGTETVKPSSTGKNNRLKKSKRIAESENPAIPNYKSITANDDYDLKATNFTEDSIFYFYAINLYNYSKFDSCLLHINSKETQVKSHYYEKLQFLKANVLIKLNRNEEAKLVLKNLIAIKGTHYRKAKRLLKTLK